jgi:hypothetical protein
MGAIRMRVNLDLPTSRPRKKLERTLGKSSETAEPYFYARGNQAQLSGKLRVRNYVFITIFEEKTTISQNLLRNMA